MGLTKSASGHVMLNFIFASVGSAGHIVHSGALEARNVDTPFFMLGWDRYGFHKNCKGARYIELLFLDPVGSARHVVHSLHLGRETSMHYFSCSGGTSTDLTKSVQDTLGQTCVFCIWSDLRVT
jgi:hypothetical protein